MPFTVGAGGPDVEDGTYPADLESIEEAPKNAQKFGPAWQFTFNVYVEGEAEQMNALVSQPGSGSAASKSKFVKWATILLGRTLSVGDQFELDDLIGKPCRVLIARNDNDYATIKEVLPQSAKKKAPAAAAE